MVYSNFKESVKKLVLPKSTGILLVVFCTLLGYALSFSIIKSNLVQYTSQHLKYHLQVQDERTHNPATFELKVKPMLGLDSMNKKETILWSEDYEHGMLFNANPAFLIWTFLICAMIAIASGTVPFFVFKILELKIAFGFTYKKILMGGFFFAALMCFFLWWTNQLDLGYIKPSDIINKFNILFKYGNFVNQLVTANLILIVPGMALMFLIGAASDKIYYTAKTGITDSDTARKETVEIAVKRIKLLNQLLQTSLQILATIVAFTVLTSSALGEAIRSAIHIEGIEVFPKQIPYIYGMYFTFFLSVLYIPIYYYLGNNYNKLKELASEPGYITDSATWYTALFGEVKFEKSGIENLKLALTLLAPILTSFLPKTLDLMK
ncbi:MAG: hypothetical protein ACHQRM_16500 [Bacteroidia bacterium]